jgi:hypothetical protein
MKNFTETLITILSWALNGFGVVGLALLVVLEPKLW